jgi:hypothetical protein
MTPVTEIDPRLLALTEAGVSVWPTCSPIFT